MTMMTDAGVLVQASLCQILPACLPSLLVMTRQASHLMF